jgi:Na+:H+ antiporter, NhaA family
MGASAGPLRRLLRPLEHFLRIQAAAGVVLLLAAAAALGWANSGWGESYARFWNTPLGLRIAGVDPSLAWLVNDGLMAVFFFVVGLEIRREIQCGELSEWRRAALPVAAAIGGMLVPAAIYLALAGQAETRAGWGVPMATDIAFAVGILTLLGKRVPAGLRVLLLALAIIDDLGAIVVIALFYSSGLDPLGLGVAFGAFGVILLLQRFGVLAKLAYLPFSLLAWGGTYAAGIHPTIAGVALGLMTPVVTQRTKGTVTEAPSPAESLIQQLHPWVAFGIMPLFALANAGVTLNQGRSSETASSIALAVAVGLVIGKPLGVLLAAWISLKLGLASLPAGIGMRQLLVLGVVAGVGFTMALFIAQLAFPSGELLAAAKWGVVTGSAIAAVAALLLGRLLLPTSPD